MKLVFPYKQCYNCISVDEKRGDIKKSLLRLNENTKYDDIECNLKNIKLDESSIVFELEGMLPYEIYIIKCLRLLKDFGTLVAFIPKFEFTDNFIKEMQKYGEVIDFDKNYIKIRKRYFVKNKLFYDKINENRQIEQKTEKSEKVIRNNQNDQNNQFEQKIEKTPQSDKIEQKVEKSEKYTENDKINQNDQFEQKIEKTDKNNQNVQNVEKSEKVIQNDENISKNKKIRKNDQNEQKTTKRRGRPKKSKKGE